MATYENTMRMDAAAAQELCTKIFIGAGAPAEDAATVADNLIRADLRGVGSHGVSRMMVYCDRLDSGMVNVSPSYSFKRDKGAIMVMDADNGLGAPAGVFAMDKTIERAKSLGMAACAVCNANHYGIAAYYGMRALPHDMIGMAFTSAPSNVAPWGGIERYIGTNPICYTVPAKTKRPLVFDAATSIVARGKLSLAEIEGRPIPEGWALDTEGNPTTDATAGLLGTVLPFGTYKGSGIAIFIDVLCAMLSGAEFGSHIGELYGNSKTKQNLGYFFMAFDIAAFEDVDTFKARVDQMIDEIKANKKAPGVEEIFLPGELEFNYEDENSRLGIEVGPGVLRDLQKLCERYGLPLDPHDCLKK